MRTRRCIGGLLAVLVAVGVLAVGASAAFASFPSTPTLDNFATDTSLNPGWTTPALGEYAMTLDPVAGELTGTDGNWDVALWNTPFSGPVEVWATINRAGTNDGAVYADVQGTTGAARATGGYFADFGGANSGGSPGVVSIWRIDDTNDESELDSSDVGSPYTGLNAGDQIGMSVSSSGAIVAWYKPSGGVWSAEASTVDPYTPFTSGGIALESTPGTAYGFSAFGGGAPSATTTTTIGASAGSVNVGGQVTYTASVVPVPTDGSVAFEDGGVTIPGCGSQTLDVNGQTTCSVTYNDVGTHVVNAVYAGSLDGAFGFSTSADAATVGVTAVPPAPVPPATASSPTATTLSVSSTTPAVGAPVLYTARVSPAPDGGTVSFVNNGAPIGGCQAQAITKGIATCRVTYMAPGAHRIDALYVGDSHYRGSAASGSPNVTVSLLLAGLPRVRVGRRSLIAEVLCPAHSRDCRVASTADISLPGVRRTLALKPVSATVRAGHPGWFTFALNRTAQAKLRSYLRQHHHAQLSVFLDFVVRNGNGTTGTLRLAHAITRAPDLARL